MPNSIRRLTPDEVEEDEARNPNHPENDGGAVPGPAGGRQRDENSLSFRHFLQPHSDVVPHPAPTRSRSSRGSHAGGVDLVEVTMALPDFVQDHLVMESLASAGERPNDSPLDLNVLNEILPDFGPSQRNHIRISQGSSRRRSGHEQPTTNGDSPHSHGTALPDFLSDGPMHLNNNDVNINNSPSSSSTNRANRCRPPLENHLPDEPVRGPSFESKESLRLEINRLRRELAEKARRLNQLDTELTRCRSSSGNLETTLRTTERNLAEMTKRALEAEKQIAVLQKSNPHSHVRVENGHGDDSSSSVSLLNNGLESHVVEASAVLNVARSSEILISQLLHQVEELKRMATTKGDAQLREEKCQGKNSKKPHQ